VAGKRVLIDTGPLVATYRQRDEHHVACTEFARLLPTPQYTCWPVITEACYLLKESPDAVQSLLAKIQNSDLILFSLTDNDAAAIGNVMAKYRDQGIDLADACLIHLAERESISSVFTLDRRHFSVYRTATGQAFSLIPD